MRRRLTGFATLESELYPKRLALMKEAVPGLNKVGVIISSLDPAGRLHSVDDAGRALGMTFVPGQIDRPEDIDGVFERFAQVGVKAAIDISGGLGTFMARERIAALAIEKRMARSSLPSSAGASELLSYGVDVPAHFKRAATLVDRILKGAKPADLPVEQVNVYELVVNLRTARALGIELPRSLMLQATRVIE